MRLAVLAAAAVLALAAYANAECANACSGHGICSTSDQCDCFPNYKAADCSERVCPYGFAWVDSPRGDLNHDGVVTTSGDSFPIYSSGLNTVFEYEAWPAAYVPGAGAADAAHSGGVEMKKIASGNEGHFYSECSNKGLCDRATAECVCYDGYTGSSCQRTTCANDCSGHGVCRTVEEVAKGGATPMMNGVSNFGSSANNYRKIDSAGTGNYYEGSFGTTQYRLWDMDMAQTCVCDPGYTGADCSRRQCPRGDDPLTHRASDCGGLTCNVEVQTITVATPGAGLANADYIYLQFKDWTGKVWNTDVIAFSDLTTGKNIQDALQAIPNGVLGKVTVNVPTTSAVITTSIAITFTGKPGNVEPITVQYSHEMNARRKVGLSTRTATFNSGTVSVETTIGTEEESTCSNRGVCDYDTGICKCFKGYTMDDCSIQNALAM
jgi:hypothetical protein